MKSSKKLLLTIAALLGLLSHGYAKPPHGDTTAAKLSLEVCYAKATENYPLIKQRELIPKNPERIRSTMPRWVISPRSTSMVSKAINRM